MADAGEFIRYSRKGIRHNGRTDDIIIDLQKSVAIINKYIIYII